MTIQDLIDLLNKDLALEYSAAIQYYQHSAVMKSAAYIAIANDLRAHADEEIGHAKILNDFINFLGGVPAVDVGPIKTADDNDAMLTINLGSERNTIERYTERIEQATELKIFALVDKLQGIISDEQDHALAVMTALGM
jgi:bacterioferritin